MMARTALEMNGLDGGWSHSAGTEEGVDGTYTFELSRLLVTAYTGRPIGEAFYFGASFWDPNQKEDGWSDYNHYVSGCGTSAEWFHLSTLVPLETVMLAPT